MTIAKYRESIKFLMQWHSISKESANSWFQEFKDQITDEELDRLTQKAKYDSTPLGAVIEMYISNRIAEEMKKENEELYIKPPFKEEDVIPKAGSEHIHETPKKYCCKKGIVFARSTDKNSRGLYLFKCDCFFSHNIKQNIPEWKNQSGFVREE